jgi:hypothetical protein
MSSIITQRREAARDKKRTQRLQPSERGQAHRATQLPCPNMSLRRPAENKVSPSPILLGDGARLNPWSGLDWTPGKMLGGEADSRVWKARLYPLDKHPFVYSLHWAYAVHLTDHRDPAKIGWYAS